MNTSRWMNATHRHELERVAGTGTYRNEVWANDGVFVVPDPQKWFPAEENPKKKKNKPLMPKQKFNVGDTVKALRGHRTGQFGEVVKVAMRLDPNHNYFWAYIVQFGHLKFPLRASSLELVIITDEDVEKAKREAMEMLDELTVL